MQTASIRLSEQFTVPASPSATWHALTDPYVVVRCMPGAEIIEAHDDGSFVGAIVVSLGPTIVRFTGDIRPTFDDDATEGSLVASGMDKTGRTRAKADMRFAVTPSAQLADGSTVAMSGSLDVAGGLATFVRTGGTHLANRMVKDFADTFTAELSTDAATANEEVTTGKPLNAFLFVMSALRDAIVNGLRRLSRVLGWKRSQR